MFCFFLLGDPPPLLQRKQIEKDKTLSFFSTIFLVYLLDCFLDVASMKISQERHKQTETDINFDFNLIANN